MKHPTYDECDCRGSVEHAQKRLEQGLPPQDVDWPEPIATAKEVVATMLRQAIIDLCWAATPYGEDEDGRITRYIVASGYMNRLIGAAQGAGIPAAFRAAQTDGVEIVGEGRGRYGIVPKGRAIHPARNDGEAG